MNEACGDSSTPKLLWKIKYCCEAYSSYQGWRHDTEMDKLRRHGKRVSPRRRITEKFSLWANVCRSFRNPIVWRSDSLVQVVLQMGNFLPDKWGCPRDRLRDSPIYILRKWYGCRMDWSPLLLLILFALLWEMVNLGDKPIREPTMSLNHMDIITLCAASVAKT